MDDFQHIMIMGAGAVGGYFGGCIAERTAADVTLIARGAHLEAIRESGLTIRDKHKDRRVNVQAFDNPTEADNPDLVLFTVKSYDTVEAIRRLAPAVSKNTQVLTLQNGIENYPTLVKVFGAERVIQGFCKIGAGVPEPGVVEHMAFGSVTTGEQNGTVTERIKNVEVLFKDAGVPVRISTEITREVWLKFTWNCILNMVTAAANITVDKIFENKEGEQLCYRLFNEIQSIADRMGIKLKDKEGEQIMETSKSLAGFETSTYQDRQKGKKMEYEAFTGALVRLAEKHELSIPHNQTLYAILKMIESGA